MNKSAEMCKIRGHVDKSEGMCTVHREGAQLGGMYKSRGGACAQIGGNVH